MEVPFAAALNAGKTLPLKDLNAGFTNPETIALAYFQASVLVEHIVKTFGQEKLRALVRSYGEGLEGDAALVKTLGVSMEQLQGGFDKSVDAAVWRRCARRLKSRRRRKRPCKEGTPEALKAAAAANPGSFPLQLAYGRALASAKDRRRSSRWRKRPPRAGGDRRREPARADGAARGATGRPRARRAGVPEIARAGPHRVAARRAGWRRSRRSSATPKPPARRYERIVELDPYDAPAHTGLGRLAMKKNQADDRGARVQGRAGAAAHRPRRRALRSRRGYLLAGQSRRRQARSARRARNRADVRARAGTAAQGDPVGAPGHGK